MKIPEVSLITPTCHHHHIHSLSPPLSFAGDFAVCSSLIWMYKRALFQIDASVFSEWGAQHQTLLKKRPILATLNPSIKSFATTRRNLPPPICWKLKYQFPTVKFILWYCWAFWTHWGSHLESSDNACWISERMGFFVVAVVEVGTVCFIVSTDNKFWLQLFLPT